MKNSDPMYQWSAAAAAEILNLHLDPGKPKAEAFHRILFVVLGAMQMAGSEIKRDQLRPSDN